MDREIGGRIAGNPLQRNETVKHLNEDPRDNRRENLLPCTLADLYGSNPERKGFHGITFDKDKGRWNAFFSYNGKTVRAGSGKTPEEAAAAYNKKAIELLGEKACLNDV